MHSAIHTRNRDNFGMDTHQPGYRRVFCIPELADIILRHIGNDLLPDIRTVSRHFNSLVIPHFYRTCILDLSWEEFNHSLRFVKFISSRPDIAVHLRDISVEYNWSGRNHPSGKELEFRTRIVTRFIQRLPGLRRFQ